MYPKVHIISIILFVIILRPLLIVIDACIGQLLDRKYSVNLIFIIAFDL